MYFWAPSKEVQRISVGSVPLETDSLTGDNANCIKGQSQLSQSISQAVEDPATNR